MGEIVFVLVVYTIAREIFFLYTTHKLINKIMSRNYHEFRMAEIPPAADHATHKMPEEDPEDLGPLHAFN